MAETSVAMFMPSTSEKSWQVSNLLASGRFPKIFSSEVAAVIKV